MWGAGHSRSSTSSPIFSRVSELSCVSLVAAGDSHSAAIEWSLGVGESNSFLGEFSSTAIGRPSSIPQAGLCLPLSGGRGRRRPLGVGTMLRMLKHFLASCWRVGVGNLSEWQPDGLRKQQLRKSWTWPQKQSIDTFSSTARSLSFGHPPL